MDHRKVTKSDETFKKSSGCGDSFFGTVVADRSLLGGKFIKIPSVQTDLRSLTRRARIRKTKSCLNVSLNEPKLCKLKRSLSSDDISVLFSFSGFYGRRRNGVQHGELSRALLELLRETRAMKLSVTTPEEEVSPPLTPLTSPPPPGTDGGGSEGSGVAEYSGANVVSPSEHRASLRAALLLMLAAWRTCRVQQADTKKRNEELQQQANNLSRQISLLRQLSNTASQRAAQASSELVRSRSANEAVQRKLEELKQEQEKEKEEANRRERRLEEQTTIAENLRNDLIAVRQDLAALESQLNREREKLSKEREDKKALLERIEKAEAAEAAAISLFESVCNESRNRDEAIKEIQNLLEEAIQEREKATAKLSETEKNYAEALKTANNLRDQKKSLEEQLALEETTAVNLRRSLQIHVEEVGSLRTEVEALTQAAAANTRVGTLCMTFLRVPLALLQAINFISSPFGRGTH